MSSRPDRFAGARWAQSFAELDLEIARLALLCQVRLLDAGVIRRVLQRDASVCAAPNAPTFAKLHDMLILYFVVREKAVADLGELATAAVEAQAAERLGRVFPGLGRWPPA